MAAISFETFATIAVLVLGHFTFVSTATHLGHRKPRSDPVPSENEITIERLSQRMNSLAANVEILKDQVSDLHDRNEALQHLVSDLTARNTVLEAKVSEFESRKIELEENLTQSLILQQEQNNTIIDLITRVTDLHNRTLSYAGDQNTTLTSLVKQVDVLQDAMSVSDKLQNTTSVQLMEATKNISDLKTRMSDIDRVTSLLQTNTQSLTTSTGGLTRDVTTLKESERQLQNSILALQNTDSQISNNASLLGREITQLTSQIQSLATPVSFYARLSDKTDFTHRSPPSIIPDEVLHNQGGGYSNLTGWFTAPVAGEYIFGETILPTRMGQNPQRTYLMLDDEEVFLTDGTHSSVTAALHLEVGQRVWLKPLIDSQFGKGTSFSGALISPALKPGR